MAIGIVYTLSRVSDFKFVKSSELPFLIDKFFVLLLVQKDEKDSRKL